MTLLVLLVALAAAPETAVSPTPLGGIDALRRLQASVQATCEKAGPAMVFLEGGSGVFISADGLILTNNHVIAGMGPRRSTPKEVTARRAGGAPVRARVEGRDPGGDIALLKALDPGPYPHLELGDSDNLSPGESVVAMGNPFLLASPLVLAEHPLPIPAGPGDYLPSFSLGVVSALHRQSEWYPDAIQVDLAVNPGNSGGPLVSTSGRVVGINGKIQTRWLLVEVNTGVGYAVPSNQIKRFLDVLKKAKGGTVRRGSLKGLLTADRSQGEEGLEVVRVVAGTPSDRAGFKKGDRILQIAESRIISTRRLAGLVATYPAGSELSVSVRRGSDTLALRAVLDPEGKGWLGVVPADGGAPDRSPTVQEVSLESPAERAGIKTGDTILEIGGNKIGSLPDLLDAVKDRAAGDEITVKIRREGGEETKTIRLDARPEE